MTDASPTADTLSKDVRERAAELAAGFWGSPVMLSAWGPAISATYPNGSLEEVTCDKG